MKTSELCQICAQNKWKYTCSVCRVVYCSVPCYRNHKANSCSSAAASSSTAPAPVLEDATPVEETSVKGPDDSVGETVADPLYLRPLSSLKWPYVPDETAYPDPLKRDDPKALTLRQYEAIATSQAIRQALAKHPSLRRMLTSVDTLRGDNREEALRRLLEQSQTEVSFTPLASSSRYGRAPERPLFDGDHNLTEEDVVAFKELAEAVELAVRGEKKDVLGLDWERMVRDEDS